MKDLHLYNDRAFDFMKVSELFVRKIEDECELALKHSEAERMKWLVMSREHIIAALAAVRDANRYVAEANRRLH